MMAHYDVLIRGGLIVDGRGGAPYPGDLAIQGQTIAAIGDLSADSATQVIEANGQAITPGFINMLSWSVESLLQDGRSQSEIRQGVTLEVMGEGFSFGPLNDQMKADGLRGILGNYDLDYQIEWTTLGEYLDHLVKRGVSCNVASFVGSSTLRIHVMGYAAREATLDDLLAMQALAQQAMEEGAVGLSSALIYPPASYATTDELVELANTISEYGGLYISHIRGEGAGLMPALQEFIEVIDYSGARGEVYHLKAAGRDHWAAMDRAIAFLEEMRDEGLPVTANMYPYPYSGTGLSSCIAPWWHEGGEAILRERLRDPEIRAAIRDEINEVPDRLEEDDVPWENMYRENGPENILLCGFRQEHLKPLQGKTLAQVAAERNTDPLDTLMDLLIEDESRIFCLYFSMSEDNLRKQIALPWVSICSDAESMAPEGPFLKTIPHPRAYGSFARVLAKYVRDEQVIPLEEAIRRMTSLPAANLRIEGRGALEVGYYADVLVFDPAQVQDHATPENPHQYATGMNHVFVNGTQVLRAGEHTGALPGLVVRGPGYGRKPFEVDYPAALHPLLQRGDLEELYASPAAVPPAPRFGREYIPDLLRMVNDFRLYELDPETRREAFAPIHAAMAIAQNGADIDLTPLTPLMGLMHPHQINGTRGLYDYLGVRAIPSLTHVFQNREALILSRMSAMMNLAAATSSADLFWQDAVDGIFAEQLKHYAEDNIILIAQIARMLENRGNPEYDALIAAARKHALKQGKRETWDIIYKGGLVKSKRDDERVADPDDEDDDDERDERDNPFSEPSHAQQKGLSKKKTEAAAKKKKAKRKAAKKRR
jgi:N-acyl-D-amino-acid deacylase